MVIIEQIIAYGTKTYMEIRAGGVENDYFALGINLERFKVQMYY